MNKVFFHLFTSLIDISFLLGMDVAYTSRGFEDPFFMTEAAAQKIPTLVLPDFKAAEFKMHRFRPRSRAASTDSEATSPSASPAELDSPAEMSVESTPKAEHPERCSTPTQHIHHGFFAWHHTPMAAEARPSKRSKN